MNAPETLEVGQAAEVYRKLANSIGHAITGQGAVIRRLLSAFLGNYIR